MSDNSEKIEKLERIIAAFSEYPTQYYIRIDRKYYSSVWQERPDIKIFVPDSDQWSALIVRGLNVVVGYEQVTIFAASKLPYSDSISNLNSVVCCKVDDGPEIEKLILELRGIFDKHSG